MCVAVRKKLQLYFWKDREFHELQVSCVLCVASMSQPEGHCSSLLAVLLLPLLFTACPCYSEALLTFRTLMVGSAEI